MGSITISIHVLRSSIDVGDEGEIRWSYNDLQSVARMGDRFNTRTGGLFCNRSHASLALKGPSKVFERRSDSHSAVPLAVDMAWLSPPKVELTALGNL